MNTLIATCIAALIATTSWSMALGLTDISYPVYLAYNQGDQKIDVRWLPFASRGSSPEFIGGALSAPYMIPNDDSADLPKDINLISVCRIKISTGLAQPRVSGEQEPVALEIDLRNMKQPEYIPFDLKEVVAAAAEAIDANLKKKGCRIHSLVVHTTAEQEIFKSELQKQLEPKNTEQDGTGQPATRAESKSEGGDKPQPEAERRSR
jgi:hypothetical protein